MDHLRNSIQLYFSELSLAELFDTETNSEELEEKRIIFGNYTYHLQQFDHQTNDELENLYDKLNDDWFCEPTKQYAKNKGKSIFYLLTHFNEQVLTEIETQPYIKYEHLLKWRDLSLKLGEDIFSTSFMAYRDIQSTKKRDYFSWKSTLTTDNNRLRKLLEFGVAENHAHLYASGPTFELSWLAIMNRFKDKKVQEALNILEKDGKLNLRRSQKYQNSNLSLKDLAKLAIIFRFEISRSIGQTTGFLKSERPHKIDPETFDIREANINLRFDEIWENLLAYRWSHAQRFNYLGSSEFIDYAIPKSIHLENSKGCFYLSGERILLYNAFKLLYSDNEKDKDNKYDISKLLHGYILIKNLLREEIIQLNNRFGFGNFQKYQNRKFLFFESGKIYNALFLQHVMYYIPNSANISSYELRLGPDERGDQINSSITEILTAQKPQVVFDKQKLELTHNTITYLGLDEKPTIEKTLTKTYFTLHFLKTKPKKGNELEDFNINSRNHKLRNKIRKKALAIINLREKFPKFARFVRGIDAASSEIYARPEVFAQAFRMLKHHQLRDNEMLKEFIVNNRLRITFHAGEDFFDITDGLRYIDECLLYLGMGSGDRIGHALALGIDAKNYYQLKKNKLLIPKQTLLDNLAWLLASIRKFGLSQHLSELYRLENIFKSLYSEIYISNIQNNKHSKEQLSNISHNQYYDAWKLRGDNPELYLEYCTKLHKNTCVDFFEKLINNTYWDRCGLNNCDIKLTGLRHREEIVRLYYEYHYNKQIRIKGEETKQFEITKSYIELVRDVQSKMMEQVASKNLMIETNPTSNYLIGPIQKYVDHPITKWYNLGLEIDPDKIKNSPQICVSINTDDAGIFSTSLENEYALMAIALEKEKDQLGNPKYKPSMIYDWLDRVRQMGLQQSFLGEDFNRHD
jgi:adenosine deaminase